MGASSDSCQTCPARKYDSAGDLQVFSALGGACIFVDQAVEDGFSADLPFVDVGYGRAASAAFVVGDALGDALMRTGRVVVRQSRSKIGFAW